MAQPRALRLENMMPLKRLLGLAWYPATEVGTPDVLAVRLPGGAEPAVEGLVTGVGLIFCETPAERLAIDRTLGRLRPPPSDTPLLDAANWQESVLPDLPRHRLLHYPPPAARWPHLLIGMLARTGPLNHTDGIRDRYLVTMHSTAQGVSRRERCLRVQLSMLGVQADVLRKAAGK